MSGDDLVDGWKEGRMDGMIWKDDTKMDNGICIQTMPTQNYFISLWNMKLTLRILFQLSQKKTKGRSPRQIFAYS